MYHFSGHCNCIVCKCLSIFQTVGMFCISSMPGPTLPLIYTVYSGKMNGIISVPISVFNNSQQTWIHLDFCKGPVAPVTSQRFWFTFVHNFSLTFSLICSLVLHITAATYPLCFTVYAEFQPHLLFPCVSLPLSSSQFLFSPSAMFCDWQLNLDCNRVNRE